MNYQNVLLSVEVAFNPGARLYKVTGRNKYVSEVWDCDRADGIPGKLTLTEDQIKRYAITQPSKQKSKVKQSVSGF